MVFLEKNGSIGEQGIRRVIFFADGLLDVYKKHHNQKGVFLNY